MNVTLLRDRRLAMQKHAPVRSNDVSITNIGRLACMTVVVFVGVGLVVTRFDDKPEDVTSRDAPWLRLSLGSTASGLLPPSPEPPIPPRFPPGFPPVPKAPPHTPPPAPPPSMPALPPAPPPPLSPPTSPCYDDGYWFGSSPSAVCKVTSCFNETKLWGYGPFPSFACCHCNGHTTYAFGSPPSTPPPISPPAPPPGPQIPPTPSSPPRPPPTPVIPCSWICHSFPFESDANSWCHEEQWAEELGVSMHVESSQCQVRVEEAVFEACICLNLPPPPPPLPPPPPPPISPPPPPPPPPSPQPPSPSVPPPSLPPLRPGSALVCADDCATYVPDGSGGAITINMTFDGSCDDGGAGSYYAHCTWGTDCGDCGDRVVFGPKAPPEPPAPPA